MIRIVVQSDLIGLAGGISTYGYAEANPLTNMDPEGLFPYRGLNPVRVYNDIRDMRAKGHQDFPGENNSSMRHCVVSCMVASEYNIPVSVAAGTVNEYQGFYMHDLPNIGNRMSGGQWAFQPQDFRDNYRGYKCSKDDSGQCSSPDETPEQQCIRCCSGF